MVEVARLPRIRGGLYALLAQSPSELRGEQLYSYIAFYLFLLFYVLFISLRRALVPLPPQPQQKTAVWRFLLWSKWRDSNSRPHGPEPCALPTALHLVIRGAEVYVLCRAWSGKRESNPQPSAWEATALPLSHFRTITDCLSDCLFAIGLLPLLRYFVRFTPHNHRLFP